MIVIPVDQEIKDLVEQYSPQQDLGGFSNLKKADLSKASRLEFQFTGLYGEAAWYRYHYNNLEPLKQLLDQKNLEYQNSKKGDNGKDDVITVKGITRYLDVKTTHVDDINKIKRLNLVIPPRELHSQQVYVAAFTVGSTKDRDSVTDVVLAGWCLTEDVKERWVYDPVKWAVKVPALRNVKSLIKNEDKIPVDVAHAATM